MRTLGPWVVLGAVAAGASGAVLRWALVRWWHEVLRRWRPGRPPFPVGVLVANTLASLGAGMAVSGSHAGDAAWREVAVGGFAGGLSTLSTLAVDTVAMWQAGQRWAAALNVVSTVGLGIVAAAAGVGGVGMAGIGR
ncbi:MAG: CrcB family protein [Dermatophilaceae bacterium]